MLKQAFRLVQDVIHFWILTFVSVRLFASAKSSLLTLLVRVGLQWDTAAAVVTMGATRLLLELLWQLKNPSMWRLRRETPTKAKCVVYFGSPR